MTSTVVVATKVQQNTSSKPVTVEPGQYMLAVGGSFGSGTAQIWAQIGPDVVAPITDAAYTQPSAEVIWLPRCSIFVEVAGATAPNISVALGKLSTTLD